MIALDALNILSDKNVFLGSECAGDIVAVGSDVTDFVVGDPVIAVADNSFANYVTVNQLLVVSKPVSLNYESAAAFPVAFLTAYHTLYHVAQIKPGDRVLIHAASGGVGQAAIQLSQAAGAEIFATASPSKWAGLQAMGIRHIYNSRTLEFGEQIRADTDGQGVNVILNSLTGEGFIAESLSVLAPQGCFIEIAKRDVWSHHDMADRRPDVQYHLVDLVRNIRDTPELIQQWLATLMQKYTEGILQPLSCTTFSVEQTIDAFRYMRDARHVGKIVVIQKDEQNGIVRPDRTYLLTGGLGGLGLKVASWLVEQGAKYVLLLGRSQPTAEAQHDIDQMTASGATIMTRQIDVSQRDQLAQVLADIPADVPLGGVIHSAGTLSDGALNNQQWDKFESVFAPKVYGAWHLHDLTQTLPLDFFVLFSSVAGLLGNPGQSNHAAANVFLDALAHYRQARQLPALSVAWGAWSDIGAAAEMVQREQARMAEYGKGYIQPEQGIQSFAYLLQTGESHVSVMPVQWKKFLTTNEVKTAFFARFMHHAVEQLQTDAVTIDFYTQLKQATPEQRRTLLIRHLQNITAKVLGWDKPEKLNIQTGLMDLGMDSLMAIELRNVLARTINQKLPSTIFFTYPTLQALTDYLIDNMFVSDDIRDEDILSSSQIKKSTKIAEVRDLDKLSPEVLADALAEEMADLSQD